MIVDSRVRNGTLGLGGNQWAPEVDISCQANAVRLVPTHDEVGSDVTTWCGRTIKATVRTRWDLIASGVQDWTGDGLIAASRRFHGTTQSFVWRPSDDDAEAWAGLVRVTALPIGGQVGQRLLVSFTWPLEGAPWVVPPPEPVAT